MLLHPLRCTRQRLAGLIRQIPSQVSSQFSNRRNLLGTGSALLLAASGCQSDSNPASAWSNPALASPLALAISQISPRASGSYAISGQATLPNATQVTVTAIRPLDAAAAQPVYAILDRQVTTLSEGSWETRLNLWQPSTAGQLQEAWQTDAAMNLSNPAPTVTFLVTVDPPHQPAQLKQRVEALAPAAQSRLSRFTTDGELYLQASQVLTIQPPLRQASAPRERAPDPVQVGVIPPDPSPEAQPAPVSTQPLAPSAFFR